MPKSLITAEDLYDIETVYGCELSPDGRFVLATVGRVDKKTEKKYADMWRFSTESRGRSGTGSGQPRQFTAGNHWDSNGRWSPDGSQIAFLSNRGGLKRSQIFLIYADGGEARQLTNEKASISGLQWSPDGKSILCMVRKVDEEVLEREKDAQKRKLGIVARHITRVHYKFDGEGFLPKEQWHIWTFDAKSGKGRQLTDSEIYAEGSPVWSANGQEIFFVSNRTDDPDFNPEKGAIYAMPANPPKHSEPNLREIPTPDGGKGYLSVSPDGKTIAYLGRTGRGEWWKHNQLWIVPADGSGPARCLTDQFDYSIMNDSGGLTKAPVWSNDSRALYFQISHHGSTTLHKIDADGNNLETVIDGPGVVGSYSFNADQSRIAWHQMTVDDPVQLWTRTLKATKAKQLSRFNRSYLRRKAQGAVEEVWFKGASNNDLQGWIMTPPGFDPDKSYPSIMQMHGGPLAQYAFAFNHEFQFLAANDYVVYYCNPRGGRGYGEAHAKSIWNDHGGADVDDVLAWADYMEQMPYIDVERMGITGGSYGGFLTNWIIGHTHRFKAAVTQRSISNRLSSYGSSDINWLREFAFDNETPWENLENYWKQSPLQYIGNAKTPTLVIHSENDFRCPIEQGEQIFVALKRLGVDTEMVRFPNSSHGLSRTGRTDRRIVRLQHMLRWFDKYLK